MPLITNRFCCAALIVGVLASAAASAQEPMLVQVDGQPVALDHQGYGIELASQIFDFGDVIVGSGRIVPLTLTNAGGSAFEVRVAGGHVLLDERLESTSFSVLDDTLETGIRLNPGESWSCRLRFAPTELRAYSATVRIDTLNTPKYYNWFEVRGRGVLAPPSNGNEDPSTGFDPPTDGSDGSDPSGQADSTDTTVGSDATSGMDVPTVSLCGFGTPLASLAALGLLGLGKAAAKPARRADRR